MSELIQLAPVLVPTALMLWLLRSMSDLKSMMATEIEKTDNIEEELARLNRSKHEASNKLQELSSRIDVLEWRLKD